MNRPVVLRNLLTGQISAAFAQRIRLTLVTANHQARAKTEKAEFGVNTA